MPNESNPAANVNQPRFAPAGNTASHGEPPSWLLDSGDPLDVDILADYLLEDGESEAAPSGFDFNYGNGGGSAGGSEHGSNIVSPPQSEHEGGTPPVAESTTHHVPAPPPPTHYQHHHAPLLPAPSMATQQQQPIQPAPAPRPAPQPIQPAPAQHVAVAAMGAPPSLVPSTMSYQAMPPAPPHPGVTHIAPAPTQHAATLVAHHHAPAPPAAPVSGGPTYAPATAASGAAAPAPAGRGRKKSQAQIDRRRERNRILARRTRLRKKFFFESLQKEVMDLQRQNSALKDLVKKKFNGDDSRKVLDSCTAVDKLPEAVVEACSEHAAELDQQDFNLVRSVQQSQHSFVITDPCLQDNPIVFASDGFLETTGYTRENVLGRNCRFLQGPETSKDKLEMIRKALSTAEDVTVTFANYMADGTPFWNKLFIAALRDSSNNIVNFIGVVVKVAAPPEGDSEYGKVLVGAKPEQSGAPATIGAEGAVMAMEGAFNAAMAAAPNS